MKKETRTFKKVMLAICCFIYLGLIIYLLSNASNVTVLTFNDKAVNACKMSNFGAYVDKLNEIHYSDEFTLLEESIPQMVIYQDKDKISYVMQLTPDNAIEKLNELKYSSEYTVIESYVPLVVYYY